MRFGSRFLLSAALMASIAGSARADVKKRWELSFDHERPEHFTYRSPLGAAKNFWYLVYTVTNNTPQACPLNVDVSLHVDGRNWQQGIRIFGDAVLNQLRNAQLDEGVQRIVQ